VSGFIAVDLPPLLAAMLAALVCGLLGNWLVLRRTSLMGDAISHAILPGIVAAGLTVLLSGAVRRYARVDSGAAMGVIFTAFFALGILLIEAAAARQVDLDPDCVLYGSLETLVWFPPSDRSLLTDPRTLLLLPTPVLTLAVVTLVVVIVLRLLRKEITPLLRDSGRTGSSCRSDFRQRSQSPWPSSDICWRRPRRRGSERAMRSASPERSA
jgi:manganese/zinc/iron transport system permease protein